MAIVCTAGGESLSSAGDVAAARLLVVCPHGSYPWPPMVVPANPAEQARHCGWCGARLPELATRAGKAGQPRRYCARSCRQRAYEQRRAAARGGLPQDAVVLSGAEFVALRHRLFQLRCAAEDVVSAADDSADPAQLRSLAARVGLAARLLERLR